MDSSLVLRNESTPLLPVTQPTSGNIVSRGGGGAAAAAGGVAEGGGGENRSNEIHLLTIACALTTFFCLVELIGGYYAGSLAVMSDAAHLMSDLAGFLISLLALSISCLPANAALSFGFARAEVLGAFVSVFFIWVLTILLVVAAVRRLLVPTPVNGPIMFMLGCIGLAVNIVLGLVLGHGHSHSHGADHHHDHSNGAAHNHAAHAQHSHSENHSHPTPDRHSSPDRNIVDTASVPLLGPKISDPVYSEERDDHSHAESRMSVVGSGTPSAAPHGHMHPDRPQQTNVEAQRSSHTDSEQDHGPSRTSLSWWKRIFDANDIDSLNIRAAYLHVLGDALQNVGVIIAALIISVRPTWVIVDPICTLVFAVIVVMTTKGLARDAFFVLMEGTPPSLSLNEVYNSLLNIPGVKRIGDLHIWSITGSRSALSAHVYTDGGKTAHDVLKAAQRVLASNFGIDHVTIQLNCEDSDCCDGSVGGASQNCVSAQTLANGRP